MHFSYRLSDSTTFSSILPTNIKSTVIHTVSRQDLMCPAGRVSIDLLRKIFCTTNIQNTRIFTIFLGRSKETLLAGWTLRNLAAQFSRITMFHMFQGLRFKPNCTPFLPSTNTLLPNSG